MESERFLSPEEQEPLYEGTLSHGMDLPSFGAAGEDNRPETVQRNLIQQAANNSPQVKQLRSLQEAANQSEQVQQLKSLQAAVETRPQISQAGGKQGGGLGSGGAVQRKISAGGIDFPATFKAIAKKGTTAQLALRDEIWGSLQGKAGGAVNLEKLEQAWNKAVKAGNYNLDSDRGAFEDEVMKKYQRSMNDVRKYQARSADAGRIGRRVAEVEDGMEYKSSGRKAMVTSSEMMAIDYQDLDPSREERFGTHAATTTLASLGGGEEAQASLAKDKSGMLISTNLNGVNKKLAGQVQFAHQLKKMAADLLVNKEVTKMSREDAMADRVIRHTLKLFHRISTFLAADAPITVPAAIPSDLPGVHAEIRIEQSEDFSADTHEAPTGTKLPCMGCYLYFEGRPIEMGNFHGPMWVTNAALSQQLLRQLRKGRKLGTLGNKRARSIGRKVRSAAKKRKKSATMATSMDKHGDSTTNHNPDSESELSEGTYAEIKADLKEYSKGTPIEDLYDPVNPWDPESEQEEEEDDYGPLWGQPGGMMEDEDSKHAHTMGYNIESEDGVDPNLQFSVIDFLRRNGFQTSSGILVVKGEAWHCYIRAVLHHFGAIGRYSEVKHRVESSGLDLSRGVVVGSQQEKKVQDAIEGVLGTGYYAHAISAAHGHGNVSRRSDGGRKKVDLLLTGGHFSLLRK